jgi:hypothetical protein
LLGIDGPVKARPHAKAADHIHHAVAKLVDGEPGQILLRRIQPRLRRGRVKRIVHVFRDQFGVLGGRLVRVILRHRAVDLPGEGLDGLLAGQRLVVFILHALAAMPWHSAQSFL